MKSGKGKAAARVQLRVDEVRKVPHLIIEYVSFFVRDQLRSVIGEKAPYEESSRDCCYRPIIQTYSRSAAVERKECLRL